MIREKKSWCRQEFSVIMGIVFHDVVIRVWFKTDCWKSGFRCGRVSFWFIHLKKNMKKLMEIWETTEVEGKGSVYRKSLSPWWTPLKIWFQRIQLLLALVLLKGKILQPKKEKRKSDFLADNETLNIVFDTFLFIILIFCI